MKTNISISGLPEEQISKLLLLIGQPARIQILFILGAQEACVCHLEAATGMRQAAISQHLMVLRKAGLVLARREGRNIFYQLTQADVIDVLVRAAQLTGIDPTMLWSLQSRPIQGCPCPQCCPDMDPNLTCRNIQPVSN